MTFSIKRLPRRAFLRFVVLAGLSLSSPLATSETLQEIYQAALASDPQLREIQAQFEAASETVALEKSARLPQVNAKGTLTSDNTRNSDSRLDNSNDQAGVSLSLSQSLWNQKNGANIARGRVDEQIAAQSLENTRLSLVTRSAEAYFNLLRALDQQRTAINEEQTLGKQLEQTRERFDVGVVPINDVTEAQAAFDNAVASSIAAESNVGISSENLAILTGGYLQRIAPLAKGFDVASLKIRERDYWVKQALKANRELRITQLELEAAEFRHEANRANQKPELKGNLGYSYNRDLQADNNRHTTSMGLELNIPLYGGGRFSAQRRQSAQGIIQAQEKLKRIRRSVTQQSRSLYLQVSSSLALISARQQSIVSSQSALNAVLAGYDAGTKDIVDVVNAQQKVFQAQRNYSDALYNHIINYLRLKDVAGELSADDITALDAVLDKDRQLSVGTPG